MKEQLFEKQVTIENYQDINFVGSDGRRVTICKVTYSYRNEIGTCFKEVKVPYDCVSKLEGNTYPKKGVIVFSVEDLTRAPIIADVKLINS